MPFIDGKQVSQQVFAKRTKRPRGQAGKFLDGRRVPKEEYYRRIAARSTAFGPGYGYCFSDWNEPVVGISAGFHPSQLAEARAHDAKHGLKVEYTRGGDPIFTSKPQQDKYLKAWKLHHKNSFT